MRQVGRFDTTWEHSNVIATIDLRKCIDNHWDVEDFVVLMIDMRNAFNLVSSDALPQECATFFPELLPWASWYYSVQPLLWRSMGHLSTESGVQQGDPLGPLFFALVLHQIVSSIDADDECLHLLYQAWYLDDGTGRYEIFCPPSFVFN